MAEYIERKLAYEYIQHTWNEWNLAMAAADGKREINHVFKMQELCKAAQALVNRVPAADVVPVVHGRWLPDGGDTYCCSCCGILWTFLSDGPEENDANYCPNCGAKMDGD